MQELKRNRQALTAAVYEEARVSGFEGSVLKLAFPRDQSFYVGMASDRKHADELGKVLEERLGTRPRLEIAVYDSDEPPFASGPTPAQPLAPETAPEEPREAPLVEEPSEYAGGGREEGADGYGSGAGATASATPGGTPQAAGGGEPDDIIRDPREVVEMARQRFGGTGRDTGGGN